MKKSKYVFAILSMCYVAIFIIFLLGWIEVTENILLSLSCSSLFISLSDMCESMDLYTRQKNEFQYILKLTCDYLGEKIAKNDLNNPNVNIRNLKKNLDLLKSGEKNYLPVHPNDFESRRKIKWGKFATIPFIAGISAFVIFPFINLSASTGFFSVYTTVCAFTVMCFGLYIRELTADITDSLIQLRQDKHLIIQMVYPDFLCVLNQQLFYREDIGASNSEPQKNATDVSPTNR